MVEDVSVDVVVASSVAVAKWHDGGCWSWVDSESGGESEKAPAWLMLEAAANRAVAVENFIVMFEREE